MNRLWAALAAILCAGLAPGGAAVAAATEPRPLFAADEAIRLTLRGPLQELARKAEESDAPHPATLTLGGPAPETHSVRVSARGISRRRRDICTFPMLLIEFDREPGPASLFAGHRKLRLVTHCRPPQPFQKHALLEYAAYRLYNVLTPASVRVRLAAIDYFDGAAAAPFATRSAFLIEDTDDVAGRNGLAQVSAGERIRVRQLSARDAGRVAFFQYMIGNIDCSMHAGPPGELCCHNTALLGAGGSAPVAFIPVPY